MTSKIKPVLLTLCLIWTALAGAGSEPSTGLFDSIGARLGLNKSGNPYLEVDDAFAFSAEAGAQHIVARWQIADGYYLYRDKFKFELKNPAGITLGPAQFPPGKIKADPNFGDTEVYHNAVDVMLPLQRDAGTVDTPLTLQVQYQGCAEAGFCYPPVTKSIVISLPAAGMETTLPSLGAPANLSEQDRLARLLTRGNLPLALLIFFGLGILLAFTPCVFPTIPILSSIIVGQGAEQNTRRAFILSLVYVLAMAVTYTVAGVIAGLFGANLQAAMQNPWVLSAFSALFVALALAMFGLYQLQLPAGLQTWLTGVSTKQKSGSLYGVAVMGLLSALIVGPCLAAPLAAALIVIGQSGDALLGGAALFALSLGMGAPLILIGASLGRWLPTAGAWMNTLKSVFGVLLLALAIWMLSRILPAQGTLALWALLLIVSGVYMGALTRLYPDASGWRKLWQGLGIAMLVYGALLLVGAASGAQNTLQPLQNIAGASSGKVAAITSEKLPFKRIKSLADLEREISAAQVQARPVMLDFYADWCVSCIEMEKFTFSHPKVHEALSGVILLQADVTAQDETDLALQKGLGVFGPPTLIFFGQDGREKTNHRLVGTEGPEAFEKRVRIAFSANLQPSSAI
ncbi:MAG: protein-disulfide reductase DsbD [Gammaproteobacteria bacterium]|nr:protein-disulfide reductase DsbD [Gammaproteobacteria bacterium]